MSIITLYMLIYNQKQFKLENYFISNKAVRLQIDNMDINKIYNTKVNDFMIYNKYDGNDNYFSLLGIFLKGNNDKPQIIKGRFFEETDFFSGNKFVVIGKDVDISKHTIIKDNEKYFVYNNKYYKVIGVMGYDFNCILNGTVFFNIDSIPLSKEFYIDSNNLNNIDLFLESVSTEMNIKIVDFKSSTINTLIDLDNQPKILFLLLILFIQFNLIIAIMYFIKHIEEGIYIKKIIGFDFFFIFKENIIKLMYLLLVSYTFSICSFYILYFINLYRYDIDINIKYLVSIFCIIGLEVFTIFFLILIIIYNKKYKIWR